MAMACGSACWIFIYVTGPFFKKLLQSNFISGTFVLKLHNLIFLRLFISYIFFLRSNGLTLNNSQPLFKSTTRRTSLGCNGSDGLLSSG